MVVVSVVVVVIVVVEVIVVDAVYLFHMDMLDHAFGPCLMMMLMLMIKIILIIMRTMVVPVHFSIANIGRLKVRVTIEVAHGLNIGNGGNRICLRRWLVLVIVVIVV